MSFWQGGARGGARWHRSDERAVVARGAGRSVLMQGAGLALGYAVHVLLARWMGAAGYGAYTYVLAWASLLAVPAGCGLPLLMVRFVPEYSAQAAWGRLRGVLQWGSVVVPAGGIGLALAGMAAVGAFGETVGAAYTRPLLLGLWMVPLQAVMNSVAGIYQGVHRVGRAHGLAVLRHGLVLVLAFALWQQSAPLTPMAALGVTLAATGAVLVGQVRTLRRALPPAIWTVPAVYDRPTWRRVAFPLLLVSGFVLILHQADVLMVGSLLGPEEAGLYRAASKTAGLVGLVFAAAVAAAGPMMAALHAEGAPARLQRLAATVAHGVFWPSLVLGLALMMAAGPVLRLFGPAFEAARPVLMVLLVGYLAQAAAGIGATVLNLTGHQDWGASVFGWGALLNVGLNAVGIAWLGLVGAAVATAVTLAVTSLAFALLCRRRLRLDPSIVYALRAGRRKAGPG